MKTFHIHGDCNPKLHYMVNMESRLRVMKEIRGSGVD